MRLGEMKFPKDVSLIIADYAAIWTMVPWVPRPESLMISHEWRGVDLSIIRNSEFCANPNAGDVISNNFISTDILGNPADWAVEMAKAEFGNFPYRFIHKLAGNTNPRVIEFIKSSNKIYKKRFYSLLGNPAAIDLIRDITIKSPKLYKLEARSWIFRNPNSEPGDWPTRCSESSKDFHIAMNPSPTAIEYLKTIFTTYGFMELTLRCPLLFLNTNPWVINLVESQINTGGVTCLDDSEWDLLSTNHTAVDILKAHPEKITTSIWRNPGIFEPTIRHGISDILNDLTWPAS